MYERFTDRARKVMQLASQEAQRFNYEYIGTEHILLGLVREGYGVAANILTNLNIDLRTVRLEVERIVQPGPDTVFVGRMPQTPRAKRVIEHAIEEARSVFHDYVGTEHLLLGLLREEEGVAAQILIHLGLKLEDVREEIVDVLGWGPAARAARWSFPGPDLPRTVRPAVEELKVRIEQLNQAKGPAVVGQNFERAAHLRDRADELRRQVQALYRDWLDRYAIDPSWLSWNGGTVAKMARVIGKERRWQELTVLADALEEAGCTDAGILDHCRQPGEHARHCWVVDLLLRNV
jgi:ATP-dependent Clp protease ATP-binding subunit ClpA